MAGARWLRPPKLMGHDGIDFGMRTWGDDEAGKYNTVSAAGGSYVT